MRPPIEDPVACREWFEDLWLDVCRLRERYMLPVRTSWWENPLQVETLAALAAWVERYDSGEWDDPPGKLSLLFELERLQTLLRDGNEPFVPGRDSGLFTQHLTRLGCQPPPDGGQVGSSVKEDDPTPGGG